MKKLLILVIFLLAISFVYAEREDTREERTCEPYCSEGMYYTNGIYNSELKECEYQYRSACECNSRSTGCSEERDCPDYCSNDIYYQGGNYNSETKVCDYRSREVCRLGCNLRQNACAVQEEVPEEPEEIEKTCTDSDNEKDFQTKGKVEWTYGDEEGSYEDHCIGSSAVEYYCENDLRAVIYKECSKDGMICKEGSCVELKPGECIDPDGDDLTIQAWAEGTNSLNPGLVIWADYCTETIDGAQTETGVYINEAICEETSEDYYELSYAKPQKCLDGCENGICLGSGKAEEYEEEKVDGREQRGKPEKEERGTESPKGLTNALEHVTNENARQRLQENLDRFQANYQQRLENAEEVEVEVTDEETGVMTIKTKESVKYLGFIKGKATKRYNINAEGQIEEKAPWYKFLYTQ